MCNIKPDKKEEISYESDHQSIENIRNETDSEYEQSDSSLKNVIKQKEFELDISYENYCKMKPVSVIYGKEKTTKGFETRYLDKYCF